MLFFAFIPLIVAQLACPEATCDVRRGCTLLSPDEAPRQPDGCPVPCAARCEIAPVDCPLVRCPRLAAGCTVRKDDTRLSNSCLAFPCGVTVCASQCPSVLCAPVPPGCAVKPSSDLGPDGCLIEPCGQLSCEMSCPQPACAAPPPGCFYEPDSTKTFNGCLANPCGKLVCKKDCPQPLCESKEGCRFVPDRTIDPETGCPAFPCGRPLCVECPVPDCPPIKPTLGCAIVRDGSRDERGCLKNPCGTVVCPDKCPAIGCAAPPPGCFYGPVEPNSDGCITSCGPLVCKECVKSDEECVPPFGCKFVQGLRDERGCPDSPCGTLDCSQCPPPPPCVPPLPGCRYVQDGKVNEAGCPANPCGSLVCGEECKDDSCSVRPPPNCELSARINPLTGCKSCTLRCSEPCKEVECPEPRMGCKLERVVENGCTVCRQRCDPSVCPVAKCAPPPRGCEFVEGEIGENGCPKLCQTKCNCPAVGACPPPRPGCKLVRRADDLDDRGCINGCGQEVCEDCPSIHCPEFKGCTALRVPFDERGCQTGCGLLRCDADALCETKQCPAPNCPIFKWVDDGRRDARGCPANPCGFVCASEPVCRPFLCPMSDDSVLCPDKEDVDERGCLKNPCRMCKAVECDAIKCPVTKDGCRVKEGSIKRDNNGCQLSCGEEVCDGSPMCPVPDCEAPREGCMMEENDSLDRNGCPQFPCGKEVCTDTCDAPINACSEDPPAFCVAVSNCNADCKCTCLNRCKTQVDLQVRAGDRVTKADLLKVLREKLPKDSDVDIKEAGDGDFRVVITSKVDVVPPTGRNTNAERERKLRAASHEAVADGAILSLQELDVKVEDLTPSNIRGDEPVVIDVGPASVVGVGLGAGLMILSAGLF